MPLVGSVLVEGLSPPAPYAHEDQPGAHVCPGIHHQRRACRLTISPDLTRRNFLVAAYIELFRTAYFQSDIFPALSLEKQQEMDYLPRRCSALHRQLLDNLSPPQDYADLMERGNSFVRKFEAGRR
jgi:hypothetical protein